jgi:hypothetical protein
LTSVFWAADLCIFALDGLEIMRHRAEVVIQSEALAAVAIMRAKR